MPDSPIRDDAAIAHVQRGVAALTTNDPAAARTALEAALALEPAWAEPRYLLAHALFAAGDLEGALAMARSAAEADPAHANATHLVGTLHCDLQRYAEALPWLERAAAAEPDRAEFQRDLGVVRLFLGDIEPARADLHRALALDPLVKDILPNLVRMTPMDSGDPEAARLFELTRSLAERLEELPPPARVRTLFALGKALEDRGDFDGAFDAYARANAMHRQTFAYDVADDEARFAAVAERFDAGLIERLSGAGAAGERPIFIVGMPRSGTTLIEQIISAHPDVHGAGEVNLLQRMVGGTRGTGGSEFPDWAAELTEPDLAVIGQALLDGFPPTPGGEPRQTIKRLENFEYIGLIHLCLPNAVIIHCRRDPRDCCVSAFGMLFVDEQAFSYDLAELGRYWCAYDRLMAHWDAVLPPGRVLAVPYEALVADLEDWTRRLLAHCRLDWDDACLRFYESRRPVRSASFAQVRQPIFTTSIGRWRPFARHLSPLVEAMGDGARLPDAPVQADGAF